MCGKNEFHHWRNLILPIDYRGNVYIKVCVTTYSSQENPAEGVPASFFQYTLQFWKSSFIEHHVLLMDAITHFTYQFKKSFWWTEQLSF